MLGLHVKLPLSVQSVLSDLQETCCGRSWAVRPQYSHLDFARSRASGCLLRHWDMESSDSWEGIGVAVKSFSKLISPLNKII